METKMDVRHIAKLARLKLPEEKVEKFETEMKNILSLVENLPPLDSGGALLDENNTMLLRPDEAAPSFPRESLLANTPQTVAGCIRLPKLLDREE